MGPEPAPYPRTRTAPGERQSRAVSSEPAVLSLTKPAKTQELVSVFLDQIETIHKGPLNAEKGRMQFGPFDSDG